MDVTIGKIISSHGTHLQLRYRHVLPRCKMHTRYMHLSDFVCGMQNLAVSVCRNAVYVYMLFVFALSSYYYKDVHTS